MKQLIISSQHNSGTFHRETIYRENTIDYTELGKIISDLLDTNSLIDIKINRFNRKIV